MIQNDTKYLRKMKTIKYTKKSKQKASHCTAFAFSRLNPWHALFTELSWAVVGNSQSSNHWKSFAWFKNNILRFYTDNGNTFTSWLTFSTHKILLPQYKPMIIFRWKLWLQLWKNHNFQSLALSCFYNEIRLTNDLYVKGLHRMILC